MQIVGSGIIFEIQNLNLTKESSAVTQIPGFDRALVPLSAALWDESYMRRFGKKKKKSLEEGRRKWGAAHPRLARGT